MYQAVVTKYLACAEFDTASGECTAQVWVDPPAVIPPLSMADGFALASAIGCIWVGVVAVVLPRHAAKTSR